MRRLLLFRLADGFRKTMREAGRNQREETMKNFISFNVLFTIIYLCKKIYGFRITLIEITMY